MLKKSHPARAPGQRAGIEVEAVLKAALATYRRDGLAGLTMRAVAKELKVAPNTLYSHVADKEQLLDAVIDAILGEVEIPDPSTEWREALLRLMSTSRTVLLRHADLMPQFLSRPARGPAARNLGDAMLRFLARGSVLEEAAVAALRILLVYTIGFAAQEAPRRDDPRGQQRQAESHRIFGTAAEQPYLRALAKPLAAHPGESTFDTGLRWLIDGIARSAVAGSPKP